MTDLETLESLETFMTPDNFCQFRRGENNQGFPTDPLSIDAVKFCVIGAFQKLTNFNGYAYDHRFIALLNQTVKRKYPIYGRIDTVNDHFGLNAVKEILKLTKSTLLQKDVS